MLVLQGYEGSLYRATAVSTVTLETTDHPDGLYIESIFVVPRHPVPSTLRFFHSQARSTTWVLALLAWTFYVGG